MLLRANDTKPAFLLFHYPRSQGNTTNLRFLEDKKVTFAYVNEPLLDETEAATFTLQLIFELI